MFTIHYTDPDKLMSMNLESTLNFDLKIDYRYNACMPAAKKLTTEKRKKTKSDSVKKPKPPKSVKPSQDVAADSKPKTAQSINSTQTTPLAAKQPLPMPVTPERMPSKNYIPLTRTSYNSDKVKVVGVIIGIGIFILLIYVGWTYRHLIANNIKNSDNNEDIEISQLKIAPTPEPDIGKLDQLSTEIMPQSSTSAINQMSITQASASAQLVTELQNESTKDLQVELSQLIADLGQQGVDTTNLKAYQRRAEELVTNGNDLEAHGWLVEAIIHAKELAIVHEYNK